MSMVEEPSEPTSRSGTTKNDFKEEIVFFFQLSDPLSLCIDDQGMMLSSLSLPPSSGMRVSAMMATCQVFCWIFSLAMWLIW